MGLLILMCIAVLALHLSATALGAAAVGIARERVALGFGPRLLERKRGKTTYALCWIPLGSSVKLDAETWDAASSGRRLVVPVLAILVTAVPGVILCGGFGPALDWIAAAGRGLLHPGAGAEALAAFAAAIPERPVTSWGALLVVVTAFNALPLRTSNGGGILMELIPGAIERERGPDRGLAYDWISLVVSLVIFADAGYIAIRATFV